MKKLSLKKTAAPDDPRTACDFLAFHSGLPKTRIKDAMNKGAVRLKPKKGGGRRLRRASWALRTGDLIELHYDEKLLAVSPPEAHCLEDRTRYSVWCKPPGLLTQGNRFGDHCALTRRAELHFIPRRPVFPVHRLDREAAGLVILAHDKKAAAKLSALFREGRITKQYDVTVLGNPSAPAPDGRIAFPLDGGAAVTEFSVRGHDPKRNTTRLDVIIRTGRLHQIRRHFDMIGCPVMGDPGYGRGNKNREGMKITAALLAFDCPFSGGPARFDLRDMMKTAGAEKAL